MAKGSHVVVELDLTALHDVAGRDAIVEYALRRQTARIVGTANALSSGFRTGIYHPDHQGPHVGDTQPVYEGDVMEWNGFNVGIVHPANYAAMLDNSRNNTLLKAGR